MDVSAITTAGLAGLDEVGLERLTMRVVAGRLGVQVGGLYYHVPDKAGLLRLMADRLSAEIVAEIELCGTWRGDAVAICVAVRRVLLAHRDAARIFAGSPLEASMNALALMESLLACLEEGVPDGWGATAADALVSYVTGYVLQEQHETPPAFDAVSLAEAQRRFPRVFAGSVQTPDETFHASLEAILDGFATAARPPTPTVGRAGQPGELGA